jgi:hypothetical protein
VIVLDENLDIWQRQQLDSWGIHFRRIGGEIGRFGMDDYDEIIRLLHSFRRPTFFTRDQDFYRRWLSHPGYCLVYLEVRPEDAAQFIRRFLRNRNFRTQADRMGKIVRVHQGGISVWQAGMGEGKEIAW